MKKKRIKNKVALVDTAALRLKIKQSGFRLGFLKDELGVTYVTLQKRIEGTTAFTIPEMVKLCELLKIDDAERNAIFKL